MLLRAKRAGHLHAVRPVLNQLPPWDSGSHHTAVSRVAGIPLRHGCGVRRQGPPRRRFGCGWHLLSLRITPVWESGVAEDLAAALQSDFVNCRSSHQRQCETCLIPPANKLRPAQKRISPGKTRSMTYCSTRPSGVPCAARTARCRRPLARRSRSNTGETRMRIEGVS